MEFGFRKSSLDELQIGSLPASDYCIDESNFPMKRRPKSIETASAFSHKPSNRGKQASLIIREPARKGRVTKSMKIDFKDDISAKNRDLFSRVQAAPRGSQREQSSRQSYYTALIKHSSPKGTSGLPQSVYMTATDGKSSKG